MARRTTCTCGSGEFPDVQYDGYGIFLCYTCRKCERAKLSKFRPDSFTRYEADEPIEEDE